MKANTESVNEKMTVLVVEDNPGDSLLIEEMLEGFSEKSAYTLAYATRLSDGLTRLDAGGIDLILLDLHLPDSDGLQTYEEIRAKAPETPIIALTGMTDDLFALDLLRAGIEDYLLKSEINGQTLKRSIRYSIERMRTKQEKEKLISDLQVALQEVRQLSGLLPICSFCKKIRDDSGYWSQIEAYLAEHSNAEFSHSVCQDCAKKHYPDIDIYDD